MEGEIAILLRTLCMIIYINKPRIRKNFVNLCEENQLKCENISSTVNFFGLFIYFSSQENTYLLLDGTTNHQ